MLDRDSNPSFMHVSSELSHEDHAFITADAYKLKKQPYRGHKPMGSERTGPCRTLCRYCGCCCCCWSPSPRSTAAKLRMAACGVLWLLLLCVFAIWTHTVRCRNLTEIILSKT